jgi:hypothetical protein
MLPYEGRLAWLSTFSFSNQLDLKTEHQKNKT